MSEVEALQRDSCPACGAQAVWNPAKQALICPYCGTAAPRERNKQSGAIEEIDLVKTLREMPEDQRGWKADKTAVRCQSCQAVSVLDAGRVAERCEFCGSPQLIPYKEIQSPLSPQSLLPFKVSQAEVRESIRRWFASKWLAPGKLKSQGLIDTIHGVYLPYWTFDAHASAHWTADSGTYYYRTERVRGPDGRMKTRQVRHTRWRPASGTLSHFFDDEPIPGTRGVHIDLVRKVEPFPTKELAPYKPDYVAGFVVEHYQVVLVEAAQQARAAMDAQLRSMAAQQTPGDTHRNLKVTAQYEGQTFKHILLPVWLLTYDYGSKSFQALANGYTGRIAGEYPKAVWKIALLVILALVVILLVALAAR